MRMGRFAEAPLAASKVTGDAVKAAAGATTMLIRKVAGCWLVDGREEPAR